MRATLAACLAFVFVPAVLGASASKGVDSPAVRMDWLRTQAVKTVDGFDAAFRAGKEADSTRHYTYAAHYWLALGRDPREAEAMIRHAMDSQDMDKTSDAYGTVPWQVGNPKMKDANAIQFTMFSMGGIVSHYRDRFSREFFDYLEPHLRAGIAASRNQKVAVSYTNIFLMRACNLILLGEAIDDQKAQDDGTAALNQWLDFTRQNGITEFCSPTYTSTGLDDLQMIYRSTRSKMVRELAGVALDAYWSDAAASTFVPGGTLGGAHSRNYDFLNGAGGFDWTLYYEGLSDVAPPSSTMSVGLGSFTNAVENGYRPSAAILDIAKKNLTRVYQARCGEAAGRDRYTYFTPDFAFGSTSCNAGPQDLPISLAFANTDIPHVSILSDNLDAPYGKAKAEDKSGHVKPHHIAMPLAAVQDKGTMLALINAAKDLKTEADTIAVNVIFPLAVDEITVDGRAVNLPAKPTKQQIGEWAAPARPDSVLALRKGKGACVIRFFDVEGLDGFAPQAEVKVDGGAWDAGRLAIYQYRGEKKALNLKQSRIGVLMVGEQVNSSGELQALVKRVQSAKLDDRLDPGRQWQVSTTIGGRTLDATLDLKTSLPVTRSVDGKPFGDVVFAVDGQNLLEPIWARLDKLRADAAN